MLRAKDLETLAACESEVLAWDGSRPIEEHFLTVLPQLIESQVFVYQSFDFKKNTTELLIHGDMPDFEKLTPAFYAHLHEHPLIQATRADGNLPATRISDLVSREHFERTGLYNEFYRPIGFSHQLALSLPSRPGDVIGLVYSRKHDFTEQERQMLNLMRIHVLHMHRQAKRLDFLLRRLRLTHAMLETLDEGVIALNESLHIQQATARATEMLRRHFGVRGRMAMRRQLPQPLLDWAEQAAKTGRVARGHRFQTAAGPVFARLFRMQHGTTQGWLLKIEEPQATNPLEDLKHLGLTRRESEVLILLAKGESNAAIARELQSSHRTIEKHVEHILKKLNVNSRGAAAAIANRSMGMR